MKEESEPALERSERSEGASIQRFGEQVPVERLEWALDHSVAGHRLEEVRHGLLQAIDTVDWALFRAGLTCFLIDWGEQAELQLETVRGEGQALPLVWRERLDHLPAWPSPFPGTEIFAPLRPLLEGEEVAPRWQAHLEERTYLLTVPSQKPLSLQYRSYHALTAEQWQTFCAFRLYGGGEGVDLLGIADDFTKALGWGPEETGLLLFAGGKMAGSMPHPRWEELPAGLQVQLLDLAYDVLRQQVGRLLWHEPGTRLGIDPEHLHDMRVATRRLRAALRLFQEVLPARTVTHLRGELKWLGASLGRVRDLDVYLERVEGLGAALSPESRPWLEQYHRQLIEEREKRREALLRALRTLRFHALKESLVGMMEKRPRSWRNRSAMALRAVPAATVLLKPPWERFLKAGRALRLDSPDVEMHALRIRAKRLRYALEFFQGYLGMEGHPAGGCLPAASYKPASAKTSHLSSTDKANSPYLEEVAKRWITRLRKLQDILGEHQDLVVGQETIRALLQKAGGGQEGRQYAFVLGQVSALHAQRALECRRAFSQAWHELDRKRIRQPLERALKRAGERITGQGSL